MPLRPDPAEAVDDGGGKPDTSECELDLPDMVEPR